MGNEAPRTYGAFEPTHVIEVTLSSGKVHTSRPVGRDGAYAFAEGCEDRGWMSLGGAFGIGMGGSYRVNTAQIVAVEVRPATAVELDAVASRHATAPTGERG